MAEKKIKKEKQKLIVLIEDQKIVTNLIKMKLEKAGFRVLAAGNGKAGLDIIHNNKADLVLLDMVLPIMGGFDVLRVLHKEGALVKLPVIIISNSGQPVEIDRAIEMGVRDYLIKVNFSPEEILSKVYNTLSIEEGGKWSNVKEDLAQRDEKVNVLIVEDDVMLQDLLKLKAKQSYNTFSCSSAQEARQILANNKINIILLDILLPDENGITFLKELKFNDKFKHIPVIIISNLGQEEEINKGLKAGAEDYIVKVNVIPKDILKRVETILKKIKIAKK